MSIRIWHQHRSSYVLGTHDADAAVIAITGSGITGWSRVNYEPLHFDGDAYLAFGHSDRAEKLHGHRFVNVVRPEGQKTLGWEDQAWIDPDAEIIAMLDKEHDA